MPPARTDAQGHTGPRSHKETQTVVYPVPPTGSLECPTCGYSRPASTFWVLEPGIVCDECYDGRRTLGDGDRFGLLRDKIRSLP